MVGQKNDNVDEQKQTNPDRFGKNQASQVKPDNYFFYFFLFGDTIETKGEQNRNLGKPKVLQNKGLASPNPALNLLRGFQQCC